jgi:hypothetical protein
MASAQPAEPFNRPLFQQPWPGYWRTKTKLERLIRFKNLVIHRERWATSIDKAPPLERLVPDIPPQPFDRGQRIDQEITRIQRPVAWDLNMIGVPTGIYYQEYDAIEHRDVRTDYDAIVDYFRLPRDIQAHRAYDTVMHIVEQGIGLYELRLKQAKRELFNPVIWLAYIIRLPITVMERAGFGGHEKTQELLLGGYAKFMKIMMGIIVGLFMVRQGIKFPWKEIFNWVMSK